MELLRINKGSKIFLTLILILVIGFITIIIVKDKKPEVSSLVLYPDLTKHPIYSNYNFIQSDSVINIGYQPSYLPTGIIFEVIKRDNILKKAVAESQKHIEYFPFLKGADVNFFLQKKILDAAVGGDMPALSAASSMDIVIPVIIQKGNISMVSSGPMLSDDLRGKRIAFPSGSISHYFILELLNSAGIAENDVKLIPIDISSLATALHQNDIDLYSSWEPNVSSDKKRHPDSYITYQKITNGYLYFSKTFVNNNPEEVVHILAAVIRSINWLKSDRDNLLLASEWNIADIEKLTGKRMVLKTTEIADLAMKDILGYYSKYSIVVSDDDVLLNHSLHKEYEFMAALNNNTENNNWEKVAISFDNNLITEILKHPTKFRLYDYDYSVNDLK